MTEPIADVIVEPKADIPAAPAPADIVPDKAPVVDPKTDTGPAATGTFTEDIKLSGLKFDGTDVNVDIPADLANVAAERGVDIKAAAEELYSEGGLTEGTREALNEAFGKPVVDAYLKALDALNRQNISEFKASTEAATKAREAAWNDTLEIMGGEDRWADLDAFAVANLSEADLNEFNEVMKNGTIRMQKIMIRDLWNQFDSSGKPVATAAPVTLDLEKGESLPASSKGAAVSYQEYIEAFKSGEYRKDPKGWDARRRAGQAKGI